MDSTATALATATAGVGSVGCGADAVALSEMSAKDCQAYRLSTKLMSLLDEDSAPKALWWLDNQVFAVDPKFFQTQVLDPHFRGTKYASFLRTMHKMGFARLSRRFDLPKGVVAYACELFQKGKPQLLQKIKMSSSGKQTSPSRDAIAALLNSSTKRASPPGSPVVQQPVKETTLDVRPTKKPSTNQLGASYLAPNNSASASALMMAKEEERLLMLRNSLELEDQTRRAMMLRNASLYHQPLLTSPSYLGSFASNHTLSAAGTGPSSKLLELALLREAMNNQFRR